MRQPHEPWSVPDELTIELSMDEILEDLCWPGPPPGRWDVPGRDLAHVDELLRQVERGAPATA